MRIVFLKESLLSINRFPNSGPFEDWMREFNFSFSVVYHSLDCLITSGVLDRGPSNILEGPYDKHLTWVPWQYLGHRQKYLNFKRMLSE